MEIEPKAGLEPATLRFSFLRATRSTYQVLGNLTFNQLFHAAYRLSSANFISRGCRQAGNFQRLTPRLLHIDYCDLSIIIYILVLQNYQ